jgi:hypothetical protein
MRLLCLNVVLASLATVGLAEAPKTSIRPMPRPFVQTVDVPSVETKIAHPKPRPANAAAAQEIPVANAAPVPVSAVAMPRPRARPAGLNTDVAEVAAAPSKKDKKAKNEGRSRKGSVCGDPDIRGEALPSISSKTKGCGIADPVKVTSIAGIPFSQPATIDCETALAIKKWIEKGLRPAFGNREVVQIHIYGSYMCRTRNNQRGAKVSEHGRGKAIDIAGFVLSDGKEWTIARDYNKTIRKAQKAACGIFGTTLGPGSDGYHEDHLHFDTASYRSGAYCR